MSPCAVFGGNFGHYPFVADKSSPQEEEEANAGDSCSAGFWGYIVSQSQTHFCIFFLPCHTPSKKEAGIGISTKMPSSKSWKMTACVATQSGEVIHSKRTSRGRVQTGSGT